jgi:hypothetical protein
MRCAMFPCPRSSAGSNRVENRFRVPGATTLMNVCHLLESHHLGATLVAQVDEWLMTNAHARTHCMAENPVLRR